MSQIKSVDYSIIDIIDSDSHTLNQKKTSNLLYIMKHCSTENTAHFVMH